MNRVSLHYLTFLTKLTRDTDGEANCGELAENQGNGIQSPSLSKSINPLRSMLYILIINLLYGNLSQNLTPAFYSASVV